MLAYWTNFAHDANPNAHGFPNWKKYKDSKDSFMGSLSESPGTGMFSTFSEEHHCDFWATLGQ
jgi:carboxylesterase type B